MSGSTLDRLLAGTLPDPDGGPPLVVPTRSVLIADSLAGMEGEVVAELGLAGSFAVVSDALTREVLGERVERALGSLGAVIPVVLAGRPHADAATAARLAQACRSADVLVAVGSGTINDLCKYVSAGQGKPYVVFGTAPSMNGYTSVNAAITVDGHKRSLAAQAAAGVFLDLGVLAAAPARMIRSGLGDSLCRSTAQADWLLAAVVRGEPYREAPFALLAADEGPLFAAPQALLAGDLEAMRRLARTLVLSGFGMTICGGSMPASQGEHLISHYAEMRADPAWPETFHGEQIGVTTLVMARLQEELLGGDRPPLLADVGPHEAALREHFGARLGEACWAELRAKRLAGAALDAANQRLAGGWAELRERIASLARPAAELEAVLRGAGAPIDFRDLGWPRAFFGEAVRHAREIRARYTFLDLAAQGGRLDGFADRLILGPAGPATHPRGLG